MAPNPRLLRDRGEKPEAPKPHPGGIAAGVKALMPGRHRSPLPKLTFWRTAGDWTRAPFSAVAR